MAHLSLNGPFRSFKNLAIFCRTSCLQLVSKAPEDGEEEELDAEMVNLDKGETGAGPGSSPEHENMRDSRELMDSRELRDSIDTVDSEGDDGDPALPKRQRRKSTTLTADIHLTTEEKTVRRKSMKRMSIQVALEGECVSKC